MEKVTEFAKNNHKSWLERFNEQSEIWWQTLQVVCCSDEMQILT